MKKNLKLLKKVAIILVLIIFTGIYCYAENNWIKIENNRIEINNLPKGLTGLKIAQVSDVHLPKNASNIDNIISKVKQEKPDIILMTGDIIDASADLTTCGLDKFCKGLSEIAPSYAVTGNHEFNNGNVEEWTRILKANNVEVVDDKIKMYTKSNETILIAGLSDGSEFNFNSLNFQEVNNNKKINSKQYKDFPMILLAHRPELFYSYSSSSNVKRADIVFSGHAHGGQFRIPIINKGIVAPNQGFFPKYTSGIYSNNGVNMVVSRGLGRSIIPVRINNRPNIPIIQLAEKE
ncbi:MAG: metallophosphoesterase [Clostridiaceae bacterium]